MADLKVNLAELPIPYLCLIRKLPTFVQIY